MPTGTLTHYDVTVGRRLDFEDYIHLLTPVDAPLLGTYNDTDLPFGVTRSLLPKLNAEQVKIEWGEEELNLSESKVSGSGIANTTDPVTFNVTTGDGPRFQKGHILLLQDEYVRVTSVSGDAVTVSRAYGGSTAASHADTTAIICIGTALAEGSDPETHRFRDRAGKHNFTQTFGPYEVKISGTKRVTSMYGVPDEAAHQMANRLKEITVEIERAIIYGVRNDDTTNELRSMGGIEFYVTTNKDTSTTDLIESKLLDQFQNCYDNGGTPSAILSGGTQKRKVSGFDAAARRQDRGDRTLGRVVSRYESDFAVADVILHRYVRKQNLYIVDPEEMGLATLRPLMVEPLSKTGDSTKWQVLCEKSLKFYLEKRAAKFTALA